MLQDRRLGAIKDVIADNLRWTLESLSIGRTKQLLDEEKYVILQVGKTVWEQVWEDTTSV